MTNYGIELLSEHFGVRESVIENLREEFEHEVSLGYSGDEYSDFFIYLVKEFSQASFLYSAEAGEDIVECLEAYDATWDALTAGVLEDGADEEAVCG